MGNTFHREHERVTYRFIELKDIPQLYEMGQQFIRENGLMEEMGWDYNSIQSLIEFVVEGSSSVGIVAEDGDRLVGMMITVHFPYLFNSKVKSAEELCWWVHPDYRKHVGFEILELMEHTLKERGIDYLTMAFMDSVNLRPELMEKMYKRKGYRKLETKMRKKL